MLRNVYTSLDWCCQGDFTQKIRLYASALYGQLRCINVIYLQIQAFFIQQEVTDTTCRDPFFISPCLDVITNNYYFPKWISDAGKRSFFLLHLVRITHWKSRLYVVFLASFGSDEINFELALTTCSITSRSRVFNNADINEVVSKMFCQGVLSK